MASLLDQDLLHYFTQLNDAEKKSVLLMLKTFIGTRSKNSDELLYKEYNQEIDEALAQEDAGEYLTQAELEKRAKEW